jgi:DBF zinc finger
LTNFQKFLNFKEKKNVSGYHLRPLSKVNSALNTPDYSKDLPYNGLSIPLSGPYILVLDSTGVHRPIMSKKYTEDYDFHKLRFYPNSIQSPFSKIYPSKQSLVSFENSSINKKNSSKTRDNVFISSSEISAPIQEAPQNTFITSSTTDNSISRFIPENQKQDDISITSELKNLSSCPMLFKSLKEKFSLPLRPGYCERCLTKFDSMYDHINSETHCTSARNPDNWKSLDALIEKFKCSENEGVKKSENSLNQITKSEIFTPFEFRISNPPNPNIKETGRTGVTCINPFKILDNKTPSINNQEKSKIIEGRSLFLTSMGNRRKVQRVEYNKSSNGFYSTFSRHSANNDSLESTLTNIIDSKINLVSTNENLPVVSSLSIESENLKDVKKVCLEKNNYEILDHFQNLPKQLSSPCSLALSRKQGKV